MRVPAAPSPWDLRLAARTAALSVVALLAVVLVEWITDERGVASPGTGGRSIGVLPIVPLAGAIATLVALAPAAASGELRALASLGAPPWRAKIAAIATAATMAVASAIVIAAGGMDVRPLFPRSAPASDVRAVTNDDGSTTFASERRHVHVGPDDVLVRDAVVPPDAATSDLPSHARAATALAVALAGIALATWVASPKRKKPIRTLLVGVAYAVGLVASFQVAGARAAPALLVLMVPSLALLGIALVEWRTSGG